MTMNNPLENSFNKILASFKATLTKDESENFSFATLDDLKQTVAEIQAEQGSARRLQNLRRLDAFLEAMEQYDKVVQVFLNAADLLAFIWGPAKFMLMTASTWTEAFNTLLDAYEEIGDHIPLLKQYEDIMERCPELQIVLELIYKDILKFHQRAIKHFKNKVWKQLFHATWKTFRTDFQAVVRSLQSHKRLLDSQGILIGIQESERVRERIESERQERHKDEKARRRREVFTWLAAADSAEDQETAAEARAKYPTTGHWILQEPLIAQWCDPHSQTEPCLWINGKPGAGKTVLGSVLVEKCANTSNTNLAYFYCRAEDCNRSTFIGVCRSLICQLAKQDTSILSYVYEKSSSSGRSQLDSIGLAKEMLSVVLNAFDTLFIIIDGIDECKKVEKEHISSTLISIVESHTVFLRCCFISQHDKDTGKIFRNLPAFQITEKHNEGDILDYCVGMEEIIADSFQVSATDLQHLNISYNVAAKADGMFLLAKLVMENLLQQCTRADLEAEIERIPPDLDKAYSRLLSCVLHDAPLPEQRVAKRLLCWLLCTQRPLRWHEIQGAMSIDTDKLVFDYRGRSLIKDSKTFCGSLIEVRKSGTIELVHQTARHFLERQEELQLGPEEVNFACICLGNLTLPSHDNENSEDSIRDYIYEGYYGLSDYSVVYWQEHLNKIIRGKALDSEESLKAFGAAVRPFLRRRFTPCSKTGSRGAKSNSHLNRFKGEDFYLDLAQAMAHSSNEQGNLSKSSQECQPIVAQLLTVREIMERVVLEADPSFKQRLQIMYGQNLFKCPELRCSFFHEGFSMASERDSHRNKHTRAFVCTYPGCPSTLIGFTTSTELNKHNVDYHGNAVDKSSFPWNGKVASINIEKQIKNGNLTEVQAWTDQWEGQIPMELLWFSQARSGFGRSPLGLALRCNRTDIFEALLSQAPHELLERIDEASLQLGPSGYDLFAEVIKNGNEEIISTFLRKLKNIDVVMFQKVLSLNLGENKIFLFLSHAADGGDENSKEMAIKYLKQAQHVRHEASARYILFDLKLWESLHQARRSSLIADLVLSPKENYEFLAKILTGPNEDASTVTNQLHLLCRHGKSSGVANLLQDENLDPNQPDKLGCSPLVIAVLKSQPKILLQLIEDPRVLLDGGHIDQGMSALHWAIYESNTSVVEILLHAGLPVEELTRPVLIGGFQTTAIEYSKSLTFRNMQNYLQDYLDAYTKWDLYPKDSSMLIRSCAVGNLRLAQSIIRRAPQDLNTPDSRGVTPFLQAVKCGQHDIARFLLERGCESRSFEGTDHVSPLMVAVKRDDLEMVRFLLSKAHVDPTYMNNMGNTALDYLESNSSMADQIREEIEDAVSVAQFVLKRGYNIQSCKGPDYISPLMVAVKYDDLEMVRFLLSKPRVDPTYMNNMGKTALDYLKSNSPVADQIREEIEDAIGITSVFQNMYRPILN